MMSRIALFFVVVAFGISVTAMQSLAADTDSEKPERRGRPANNWDLSLSVVSLPDADLRGTSVDAGITDYRFKLVRNLPVHNELTLNLGAAYGFKSVDAVAAARLPDDLHALSLELGATYKFSSRSFISLKGSPGLYSDFSGDSANNLRMPLLLLGGHTYDNGISAVAGFMYRFGYHSTRFIPALGFSYQPTPQWRFDAVAPRPSITYSASRQLKLFVAGDFASDEYDMNRRKYGADVIKYSDLKLSGGVTYLPIPPVRVSAALGYAFDRQFTFYDGNRADQRIDNVPFFRLSLDMGW